MREKYLIVNSIALRCSETQLVDKCLVFVVVLRRVRKFFNKHRVLVYSLTIFVKLTQSKITKIPMVMAKIIVDDLL